MIFVLGDGWGNVDINLYDSAPITTQNFLDYCNSGAYEGTVLHRSVPGFVLQGGGYAMSFYGSGSADFEILPIQTYGTIVNEFSADRSNLTGTIAMAKQAGDPDSATSQFFFNMVDNTELDSLNGGFTVFGEVTAGMGNLNYMQSLRVADASGITDFQYAPVSQLPVGDTYTLAEQQANVHPDWQDLVWIYASYAITDANNDGIVDAADYVLLKQNYGMTEGATWEQGDFSGDGVVDDYDLSLLNYCMYLNDYFGLQGAAVPEPASLMLLTLGGVAVLGRRRRRGRA